LIFHKGSFESVPIYEYQCQSCQKVEEVQHRLNDPSPEKCNQCGKGPLRRLISQTAFVLRGGGWYNDGYSSTPKKKDTASPATDSRPASSDPAKSESKAAAPKPAAKD